MVEIVLDEMQFGKTYEDPSKPRMAFYRVGPDGKEEFLTVRHGEVLIAVTKEQYHGWSKSKIVARPSRS